MRDATAEVTAEERLREAARTDALTGMFNRRHFSEMLEAELERSRRERLTPGLAAASTSTTSRPSTTPTATRSATPCWSRSPRACAAPFAAYDSVARWGGEEFIVLGAGARPRARRCWRVCRAPARRASAQLPVTVGERRLDVTVSVGARAGRSDELARADRRPGRPRALLGQAPGTRPRRGCSAS